MFGNWTFGTLVFTVLVFTVTFKVTTQTHQNITETPRQVWLQSHFHRLCVVAGPRYSLLDLDQSFRYLGLTDLLCGILPAVGWNHLV